MQNINMKKKHVKENERKGKSVKTDPGLRKVRKVMDLAKILHKYKELEHSERVINMQQSHFCTDRCLGTSFYNRAKVGNASRKLSCKGKDIWIK